MKKLPVFVLLAFLLPFLAGAQKNIEGIWQGTIQAGSGIRIVFHIHRDQSVYVSEMDSPDQGVTGFATNSTVFANDSLTIEMKSAHAVYSGRLINDTTIDGKWIQGMSITLVLKKVKQAPVVSRPQTPVGPFPYMSEDIVFTNKSHTLQYGATITLPKGKGPFPAILLITGSGQQNRDEEIFGHKPFAVIADYLTRRGYVVLRVDDRGIGKSTGDFKSSTSADFAEDAKVSLNYLRRRKEVNTARLGLLGHSEGGMIAEMLAAEKLPIDFIVLMAGPGEPVLDLMKEQMAAVSKANGLAKSYTDQYLNLYTGLIAAILRSTGAEAIKKSTDSVLDQWMGQTPKDVIVVTTGIKDSSSREAYLKTFIAQMNSPWYRYFMGFDPGPYIQKIHAKVLALNGDKDIQVVSASNLVALRASLQKSHSPAYEIKEMKGLNHLFQHCNTCDIREYGQLQETIAPEVLETIAAWLDKNVKSPGRN